MDPTVSLNGNVFHSSGAPSSRNRRVERTASPPSARRQRRIKRELTLESDEVPPRAHILGPVQPSKVTKARKKVGRRRQNAPETPSGARQSPALDTLEPPRPAAVTPRRSPRLRDMRDKAAADTGTGSAASPNVVCQPRPTRSRKKSPTPAGPAKPQGVTKRRQYGRTRNRAK